MCGNSKLLESVYCQAGTTLIDLLPDPCRGLGMASQGARNDQSEG